jgi:transposase-like protein
MAQVSYRCHRYPPEIIQLAVWLYHQFTLSYRDAEELLRRQRARRLPAPRQLL